MRWKTKKPEPPKGGDVRQQLKFAWLPFEAGEYTVWLEFYGYQETFFEPVSGSPGWWSVDSYYPLDYYR